MSEIKVHVVVKERLPNTSETYDKITIDLTYPAALYKDLEKMVDKLLEGVKCH